MANKGPNTNGMQFFVMDGAAAHLDGGYTIFGKCEPDARDRGACQRADRGNGRSTPPKIEKVTIKRVARPLKSDGRGRSRPSGRARRARSRRSGAKPPPPAATAAK